MFNCCRTKHHDSAKITSTQSLKDDETQDIETVDNQKSCSSKKSSSEKMSPKYHVFHLKCFKKRSKSHLNDHHILHQNSSSSQLNPKPIIKTERVSSIFSKSDESENLDSLGNLPFTNVKYNVGKINFPENDLKLSSNLVLDNNNIPTTTVATSRRGSLYIFRHSDDLIVTPFAQILASLRNVRANFILITNVQSSKEAKFGSISNSSHTLRSEEGRTEGDEGPKCFLTQETLEELEWCLERLESIQTHRSVSDMASSKFKKILNKELCQYADRSKSGNQISDYICTTFLDSDIDNSIDQQEDFNQIDFTHRGSTKSGKIEEISDSEVTDRDSDAAPISVTSGSHKGHKQTVSFKTSLTDINNVTSFGIISSRNDELVEVIEEMLDTWGMDIFLVSTLSDNNPLTVISFALFRKFKLFEKFSIPSSTFLRFISEIESHYHSNVPYHNSIHAADVTQSTNVLLGASPLENVFSDLEIMAVIFACIVHDVDHPGVTNQYLINTNDQLALLYNDSSVLENHHLSVAFTVLSKTNCDIMVHLSKKQRQSFRKMVIDMVLATDMSKHMSLLADLKTMVETKKVAGSGILNLDNYTDRIQILQNMVHCADLSNPTKPLKIYQCWTEKIMQEFFQQGDKEKEKNLDISPMCDRETATIEKSQVSFIDFIVHPLWETWSDLVYPEAQDILETLEENREWYFSQIPKNEDEKDISGESKNSE